MSESLNWENVHGISFDGSRMESTRSNKVKVLVQIREGNVTVEDRDMARLVLRLDGDDDEDDFVDVFYTEDDPQSALEQMEMSVQMAKDSLPKKFHSILPLKSSLQLCCEIYEPNLPDINSDWDVVAYCV